ncbi:uncharacterized protein LOC103940329 [Pyrus x bretschneideri]|uniref:uncharacterized protein LOC103940329 n=1 Tax=Pyrus x bretschneideri TaxID=225117 RepID=UPI000511891F|nr:uncharacterized protein LOC103940329 [Pyrus x bretschneideri]
MEVKQERRSSWGWKSILQGHRILERGLKWRVGDGQSIRIVHDPWIPKLCAFHIRSRHAEMPVMVGELFEHSMGSWKKELVLNYFEEEEAKLILGLPISLGGCHDKLIWHYSRNGKYTVISGYGVAMDLQANREWDRKGTGMGSKSMMSDRVWQDVWRLRVPNKLKFFYMEVLQQYFGGTKESSPKEDASGDDIRFMDVNVVKGVDFLEGWKKIEARFKDEAVKDELLHEVVFGLWRIWKCQKALAFEGGYGSVVRDFAGLLHMASGVGGEFFNDAAMVEVAAIRAALVTCGDMHYEMVEIESDALSLINMINGECSIDVN